MAITENHLKKTTKLEYNHLNELYNDYQKKELYNKKINVGIRVCPP